MNYNKNKKLTRWVIILPILGVIVTAILLSESFIRQEQKIFKENIFESRQETVKASKLLAKQRVERIKTFIDSMLNTHKEESKKQVKNMTNFAIKIIQNTYQKNRQLSNQKILEIIKIKLRNIRFFDDLSGYFFIHTLKGQCVLLPSAPKFEGKKSLEIQDATGTYIIKKAIGIAKNKGEGFVSWYWNKPGEKISKKKLGFVKVFKPLNIYIGTARYEEDILDEAKADIQNLLHNTRYGNSGYIFAYNYKGITISHIVDAYIGVNMSYVNVEGGYSVANLVRGAKTIPSGYFMSYSKDLSSIANKRKNKTVFVKDIPELGWIIGIGVYRNFISNKIKEKQLLLKEKLSETLRKILFITLFISVIILFVTILLSKKLEHVLKNYQKNLIHKSTQNMQQQERLLYQLEHDHLTSLPNRLMLSDRLSQAINHAKRENKKVAVLFLDLDKFKTINDTLGHDVGDLLLVEVAKRLQTSIRKSDTAARLGGDEFIILLDGFKNVHDILEVISKIQNNLKKDIYINDTTHNIEASIGISVYPNDGNTPQVLLKNADIAMYKAKEDGRDLYRFFTKQINENIQKQAEVERSLHVAIQRKEFVLYYQPLVSTKTGVIQGVEALIRWQHPTKGLIFPNDFIPIAEDSKLIIEIGKWVIKESMVQMSSWKKKGYKIKKISINIAGRQLEDEYFLDYMQNTLQATKCKPEWIEIEVIERYFMKNIEKSIEILNKIRQMNIDIAMDDFGTGYSSLAYLRRLPLTKLKIDRMFIKNILNSYEDRAVAEAIIALGSGLKMIVLAEGVEAKEEKEFLEHFGCDQIQGYFFSKPVPLKDIEKLLEKGNYET